MELQSLKDEEGNAVEDYGTMTTGSDDKQPILFDSDLEVSPAIAGVSL